MEKPGFTKACWLHITPTKRLGVKALQKSRFEEKVLQYELDVRDLKILFFRDFIFPFEGRGICSAVGGNIFKYLREEINAIDIFYKTESKNVWLFNAGPNLQTRNLFISSVRQKRISKRAGNPQLIYSGVFFILMKNVMYSQTLLIQTLKAPQKVSAGIKRVMLLK